jgi:hypothetical protein
VDHEVAPARCTGPARTRRQPEALGRIEELFAQILVDEVGHVHFVRTRLDPWGIALARRLLPLVARSVGDGMPELWQLFDRKAFVAEVVRADVDGAAAPYPDRFDWSAAAS